MIEQTPDPGLPDEVLTRMSRLAETRTAGSRPFPVLDQAIHRDRVSRVGVVALAALLVTGAVAGVGAEVREGVPASTSYSPEDAGYPTKTSGSLAEDTEWLEGLRERVFRTQGVASVDDVRIVAAGDVDDRARFALVLYPVQPSDWVQEFWFGAAGDEPDAMSPNGSTTGSGRVPNDPETIFSSDGDRRDVIKDGPEGTLWSWSALRTEGPPRC